ncbi:MAG: AAA family ATPase [Oscillospiraceae bacterium]
MEFDSFAEKFLASTEKHFNLLSTGSYWQPRSMVGHFCNYCGDAEIAAQFDMLFDESQDLKMRIQSFMDYFSAEERIGTVSKNRGKSLKTNQDPRSISVYLASQYPEQYYFYMPSIYDAIKSFFDFQQPKGFSPVDKLLQYFEFCDEICKFVEQDTELITMVSNVITDAEYADPAHHILVQDILFFYMNSCEYDPGLGVDDWIALLKDESVFRQSSLEIMKRMKDYGGQATCKQLSVRYGESINFYNNGSSSLAKRIAEKTGCPLPPDEENSRRWPILYLGRYARKDEDGVYVWKLRPELSEALDQVDLSNVALYALPTDEAKASNYWFLTVNPKIWSFSALAVGSVKSYTLYNENGNKRRIFQNFLDAKAGDMIIGYESTPVKQIVAIGRVSAEQDGEKIYFEKIEGLSSPIDFAALKECPELAKMEYFTMQLGSLFRLTKSEYDFIIDMIREENPLTVADTVEKYDKDAFLDEVYMTESKYDTLVAVLKNKKNIILQGAPGVGKTYAAKRLAYSMMGEKDESRIAFVQFHQNYSYEDFMMGYKPVNDGFALQYGIFYRFCQEAANQPDKDFFFIIDEINRGNMSKIFGELLMLIERDYRGTTATLAYNGMAFSVPKNLYIIGMMNTADRSLAMIDYALRRRFSFFDIEPGFESAGFMKYQQQLNNETFSLLVSKVQELNREITLDKSLGKGFCIGHSYFCGQKECTDEWMQAIVDYDILPMLSEYWFDDMSQLQRWENILHGVFQ